MVKDKFREYLEKNEDTENKKNALTAKSYKKYSQEYNKQTLSNKNINERLGTYGDALLRHALCQILFEEKIEEISEEKKKYESDEILVKVVAKKYKLLDHIKYDKNDEKIPRDYEYGNNSYKYIATVVEALLAAFYLDNEEEFKLVVEVVRLWEKLIDAQK